MTIQGSYRLFFYYAVRSSYFLNILHISLNGTLFYKITTTPTNWGFYSTLISFNIGTNKSLLNGQDDFKDKDIAISKIQSYLHQESHTLQHIRFKSL